MSQKTRAANATQISSLLNDNTTQDITPLDVRTVIGDILDSIGMYQQLTRTALQGLITGTTVEQKAIYEISDAVSSSKRIMVFGFDSSTISTLAINLTDNSLGYYNISADTFTGYLQYIMQNLSGYDGGTDNLGIVRMADGSLQCKQLTIAS